MDRSNAAHIALPEGNDVGDIDVVSVRLEGIIPAELDPSEAEGPRA